MKRTVWMTAAIACVTTAAIAAQSPGTPGVKSMDDKTITVTGCLQDGSAGASRASTSGGYVLANAVTGNGSMAGATDGTTSGTTAPPPTSTTAGTTGTTGTTVDSAPSASRASYVLDGIDSELKKHVGHRIEVKGTIEAQSMATSSPATPATTAGSTASSDGRLKVSSVRMVSADCSSK